MDLSKLAETMPYKTRQWPWGKMLSYITARQAQDRLDDVVWPENWKVEYKEVAWNLFAWVSIRVSISEYIKRWGSETQWEWITKWDAWSESNIEKEKGHISDSFKRACVCWGIGRFLYWESWEENQTTANKEPETWFWETEFEKFREVAWNYTRESAVKKVREKYKVSREWAWKIEAIYDQ